ncbi:MAG: hypothetical protein WAS55_04940 [Saprospiraceae bacterium]|nr:hypothetical protein [Saprospiraceae bacterium]MBK9222742.1 hypothetical protein [Saprospiraceae bacterium]
MIRILAFTIVSLSIFIKLYGQSPFKVYFFLLEDCKISKAYIPEIRKLIKEFECDSIHFKAYFPNPSSEQTLVNEFVRIYKPGMDCMLDAQQLMAKKFDITVMPEVVVYAEKTDKIIYQGRIDNLFAAIGKRRSKATEHDLRDCLLKIQKAETILPRKTEAFGCYLTRL